MDEAEEGIMRLGEAYHLLQMRLVIHPTYTKALYISWIQDVYPSRKHKLVLRLNPFLDLGDSDVITDTQIASVVERGIGPCSIRDIPIAARGIATSRTREASKALPS